MTLSMKSTDTLIPRLLAVVALLGLPRSGSAAGTWSVISLPHQPGEVLGPASLAADTAGNLYVAASNRIQKRDTQGSWSAIATQGTDLGQVSQPSAMAADTAGNLYVAEFQLELPMGNHNGRIQRRDARGQWLLIAVDGFDPDGFDPGHVPPGPRGGFIGHTLCRGRLCHL